MKPMITNLCRRVVVSRSFSTSFVRFYPSTMPLKFAANISMMFQEKGSLAERYSAAKNAGFKFVEAVFPYSESCESLAAAKSASGLEQVLINSYPGW
jgi:hypothetical protein